MKHKANTLKAAAIAALLLPITALGQTASGTTGATTGSSSSGSTAGSQSGSSLSMDRSSTSGSSLGQSDSEQSSLSDRDSLSSTTPGSSQNSSLNMSRSLSNSSTSQISKVGEDHLENRVTAERLIGKKVVDRDGVEIGEVKDVGLASVLREDSSTPSTSSAGSITGGSETIGSQYGQSSIGATAGTTGISGTASTSTRPSSMGSSSQVHVYISMDDEDSLLRVPASELSFDEAEDELRLDIAQSDIEQADRASEGLAASMSE